MNTAEKIEPTITEQIAAEKEKLSLMRKRSHDATETLVNHQRELDEAWDKSTNFYFIKYANTLFNWTGDFLRQRQLPTHSKHQGFPLFPLVMLAIY